MTESMIPLVMSGVGFILAMASRPGCIVARLFDGMAHWLAKLF